MAHSSGTRYYRLWICSPYQHSSTPCLDNFRQCFGILFNNYGSPQNCSYQRHSACIYGFRIIFYGERINVLRRWSFRQGGLHFVISQSLFLASLGAYTTILPTSGGNIEERNSDGNFTRRLAEVSGSLEVFGRNHLKL